MTTNNAKTEIKQLKKSNFLENVSPEPMTREELVDALADYDYIPSYFDYLFDHFVAQGKIVKNEDDTFNRKGKSTQSKGPMEVYLVAYHEGDEETDAGWLMYTQEITGGLTDELKKEGWSITQKAAAKKASSMVFQSYKEDTAAIKSLVA